MKIATNLIQYKDPVVFMEGFDSIITKESFIPPQDPASTPYQIKKIFPSGFITDKEKLSAEQKDLIVQLGSPIILCVLGKVKEIHPYMNPSVMAAVDQLLFKIVKKHPDLQKEALKERAVRFVAFTGRDRQTVDTIKEYLSSKSPDTGVFLVLGMMHQPSIIHELSRKNIQNNTVESLMTLSEQDLEDMRVLRARLKEDWSTPDKIIQNETKRYLSKALGVEIK